MRHLVWPWALLVMIGAVNLLVGYLIRYRRQYGLMAGYDPRRLRTPERLARWTGGWGIALGLECIATGIAAACLPEDARIVLRVFAVAVIVTVVILMAGSESRGR